MELTECQKTALFTLENKITHFHGAVESEIEHLDNYKGREGTFLKKFLIGEEFNMNRWRVTWEAIKKDIKSFIGKPLVLTPERNHPHHKVQEKFRVGDIIDVGIDELKRTAWQVSHITDPKVAEMIRNEELKFGSPTVLPFSKDTVETVHLGNGKLETTLHRFKAAQDAIVREPAYGREVDFIPAICDGTGEDCALKLQEVSAAVNSDNIDQITIVPFVKQSLKKHFKAETIKDIVGYIKQADASTLKDCVSRKIKIISDENSNMKEDQIVAMAYSYCKKDKQGQIEDLIAEDIGPVLFSIKDKIQEEVILQEEVMRKIATTKTKLKQL